MKCFARIYYFPFTTGDKKTITHDQVSLVIRSRAGHSPGVTAMNLFVDLTLLLTALVLTDVNGMINLYFLSLQLRSLSLHWKFRR